ncbi:hypothetical protein X948_5342 [Burkholderia pseudomallei MSHR5608]|nr:hypothetical protein X948_5342 [Burkholderia pseudomallei MSHR5608]
MLNLRYVHGALHRCRKATTVVSADARERGGANACRESRIANRESRGPCGVTAAARTPPIRRRYVIDTSPRRADGPNEFDGVNTRRRSASAARRQPSRNKKLYAFSAGTPPRCAYSTFEPAGNSPSRTFSIIPCIDLPS